MGVLAEGQSNWSILEPFLLEFAGTLQSELCEAAEGSQSENTYIDLCQALVQNVLFFFNTKGVIATSALATVKKVRAASVLLVVFCVSCSLSFSLSLGHQPPWLTSGDLRAHRVVHVSVLQSAVFRK